MVIRRFKVREHERGLMFRDREFQRVLRPGRHWVWDPLFKVQVDVVSVRDVWLTHKDLDVIAKSGALGAEAPSGRASPRPASSTSTCASRSWTWPARRS